MPRPHYTRWENNRLDKLARAPIPLLRVRRAWDSPPTLRAVLDEASEWINCATGGFLLVCVVLALLSMGCLPVEPAAPPSLEYGSRFRYAPDAVLEPATRSALDVLATASGLPLEVAQESATRVRVVGEPLVWCDPDTGKCNTSCALTSLVYSGATDGPMVRAEILVHLPMPPGCMSLQRTLLHEMVHSLTRDAPAGLHSESGVFQAVADSGDNLLEHTSLSLLCEHAECTTFNPEVE